MGDQPENPQEVDNRSQPVNSLPLPTKFEGANKPHQADLWPKWLRRFERYRIASGLQNKPNQEQVGTFVRTTISSKR